MGFKHWGEGMVFIGLFLVIVGGPCFLIALFGSKMVNDLGNFPSQSAKIQVSAGWKIFLVEFFAFILLAVFFHIFN